MAKREQVRKNQEAAGIPDSRPFVASEAERLPSGVDRILACHINGIPISQLNLDPQVLCALDYNATDEGVAEKNARPNVREGSGIEVAPPREERRWVKETKDAPAHFETVKRSTDEFGKALHQRRDDVLDRDMDLFKARDPFKEVADKYAQPGMHPKFLSGSTLRDANGAGEYQIVTDEKGEPVKVRGMVLGHIPEEKAAATLKHYQDRGNQLLKQIGEQYKKEGGQTAVADQ